MENDIVVIASALCLLGSKWLQIEEDGEKSLAPSSPAIMEEEGL